MSQGFRIFCLIGLVGFGVAIALNLRLRYSLLNWLETQYRYWCLPPHKQRSRGISDFAALGDRGEVSPELQQQLMELVGYDRRVAEEWLTRARFGHGGRSEAYYWERAIDLYQTAKNQNGTD
jgi:hypothetical protein